MESPFSPFSQFDYGIMSPANFKSLLGAPVFAPEKWGGPIQNAKHTEPKKKLKRSERIALLENAVTALGPERCKNALPAFDIGESSWATCPLALAANSKEGAFSRSFDEVNVQLMRSGSNGIISIVAGAALACGITFDQAEAVVLAFDQRDNDDRDLLRELMQDEAAKYVKPITNVSVQQTVTTTVLDADTGLPLAVKNS